MTEPKHQLVQLIDSAVELAESQGGGFRSHLGGSMIGRKCEREIWYGFRWAARSKFQGRILRLFQRGHLEEFRFVRYLEQIGIEVQAYSERLMYHADSDSYVTIPWAPDSSHDAARIAECEAHCDDVTTDSLHVARAEAKGTRLSQWRIKNIMGHFGGSLDGIIQRIPGVDSEVRALVEFKTHNDKSFIKLKREKVKDAKREHWSQMQIYMHEMNLPFAIYMAVNKNDDDLYVETVEYDHDAALGILMKAERVIFAKQPPNRIGNHPSWYDCKFCSYSPICHFGEPMNKSCRACVHSEPVANGEWTCNKWGSVIPTNVIPEGCDAYKQITD